MGVLVITGCLFFPLSSYPRASASPAKHKPGFVEIQIRNFIFEFHGGLLKPDLPATILIKNLDKTQHGFTSPLLEEVEVRVETESGICYGKGIRGVYINPQQEIQIHFTPLRERNLTFRCDLHPGMKGELLMLSIEAI
jgi:hypothetical protein